MAKSDLKEIEFHPDAWQRFERAATAIAKTPPQHRVAKKKPKAEKPRSKRKTSAPKV